MRAAHLKLVLVLDAVALGAAAAALILGLGLPLAAKGPVGPALVLALAAAVATTIAVAGALLLLRQVGRPLDRLLRAAGALEESMGDLPLLGPEGEAGGRGFSGAAVAFERLAAALAAERARLADKVLELERANETLVRTERLATVGRLASGIAHEVGNPLGAISGYVELARDRLAALGRGGGRGQRDDGALRQDGPREPGGAARPSPGQEADDLLARIGAEAQRIDRIVRDLLDLARPAEPVLGMVDLTMPLDAALRLARVQGRFKGVGVDLQVAAGLPAVCADERRLAQVFLNLFLNAGDAMEGAGRIAVTAVAEGPHVVVGFRDTGPGIPPEDLSRVFEPFFTTKGGGQGTGLGLTISQGIVESFGGKLGAANDPRGGALFTVKLRAAGP